MGTTRSASIDPILVINPNSTERITAQIRSAVGEDVVVVTSPGGPPAIESDADVEAAVEPMLRVARARPAAAVIVACFSDPGLDRLRAAGRVPAFGIAESAMHRALELGTGVGIISSVEDSLPRHARYWDRLGVGDRVVADIALGLGVLDLETQTALDRATAVGRELVESGADVVVLGCTGMSHMHARLESMLGVPVVEPCRAAVGAARAALARSGP